MLHFRGTRWRARAFIKHFGSLIVVIVCILTISVPFAVSGKKVIMDCEALKKVTEGNVRLSTDLYKVVCSKEGNVFISPFSVEVVLALAYMGAAGRTAEQISKALYLPANKDDIKTGFKSLIGSLKSTENMTLEVANKIFSQSSYKILQEFRDVAEQHFLSGAQELDFGDAEGARKVINNWVEDKTRNKIKDLIPSGILNSMTRLVLVNAVYFKGLWKKQFSASDTRPENFYLNSKDTREIPMMHKKANFGYLEHDELDAKILEMPYQGQNLSMFVILPNEIDGISKLEEKLPTVDVAQVLKHLPVMEVEVTLPKFKLEETTDFDAILQKLGMVDMYSMRDADFSGISGQNDLYVSKVLQKAFIEVNEEGSEAAAATGMVMNLKKARVPKRPNIFLANHPFMFILQDKDNKITLFHGRLCQPK